MYVNKLGEKDTQHCFSKWKIRKVQSRDEQGEYIEGYKVSEAIGDE